MNGIIRKMDDTFPITVIEAVKVGNGTKDTLEDWLKENYVNIDKESEAGQIPVSKGDGTIEWKTIEKAEEVGF